MTAVVFVGPTLSAEEARAELDAVYLPPVSLGDVYRTLERRPRAIGIIDGYFERVPAVWHKEIMWAMTQGVHVFGSASMGALRAAELAVFGMEGVGAIFEAYRDGTLEDDDEVAVAHGPADMGYRGRSEAMVNIRCTLARALEDRVISSSTRGALESAAKALFYPERSYPRLLQLGVEQGLPPAELAALEAWLPHGRVNQKRTDAIAMLAVMRERLASGIRPKHVSFAFEHTIFWEQAKIASQHAQTTSVPHGDGVALDRVLDELRLEAIYVHVRQAAMGRLLAIEEARRQNVHVSPESLRETRDAFRRDHGLLAPGDAERWMDANDLSADEVRRFVEGEALVRWVQNQTRLAPATHLLDHLRSTGDYPRLVRRAHEKQQALELRGLQNPSLEDIGQTEQGLFRWFFEQYLGRPVAQDVAGFARRRGFGDKQTFRRVVLREYCYSAQAAMPPEQAPPSAAAHVGD
jgi:hypothetical protein